MDLSQNVPIPYRIVALMQERNRLFAFPLEDLVEEIRATGFRCACCGRCCTREINRHIFLLDHDIAGLEKIDPTACVPAPDPEFCDQNGRLYVSGYALRMKNDEQGSCWFLENGKCRIYKQRFSVCHIYPHMLRRNADETGLVTWRQFAHPNEHGRYDPALSDEECLVTARKIKEYENAFLSQQILFLEIIHEYFTVNNLRHDPGKYKQSIKRYMQGEMVEISVFRAGDLEKYRIA